MADRRAAQTPNWNRLANAFTQYAREAGLQADTAVRAASNTLTFGGADKLEAAGDALFQPGGLGGWGRRYQANMAEEQARNRYDAVHRSLAQAIGTVGGAGLGLLATGPMEGGLAAMPRLAGAAKLTGREAAAILGAGGVAGAGTQAVADTAAGRTSSAGDYAGAAVGGAAGAGATLFAGPARGGAVDGSVTSAAQDFFNGRPVSLDRAGQAAIAGNALGGLAGIGGRVWSNGLPMQAKGELGEFLGEIRSTMNGEFRAPGPKKRDYFAANSVAPGTRRSYWVPDGRSGDIRFEDKFGPGAELSPNQTIAQALLGSNFRLNSFLPADIGKISAVPVAGLAPRLMGDGSPQLNSPGWAISQP